MTPTVAWNPPPSADSLAPSWVLLPWHFVAAGAFLLVASVVLFLIFRQLRKRRCRRTVANPYATALQSALAALDALPQPAPPSEVSSIVRAFLFFALHDPVLFETQDEFMDREPTLVAVPEPHRSAIIGFLEHLEELKFAPKEPQSILVSDFSSEARKLLLALQNTPSA